MSMAMHLAAVSPGALLLLAALATAVALAQAGTTAWRRWSRGRRIRARVARAGEGEARALAWLEAMGFDVVGAQVAATYPVVVDDETVAIGVRADYLVEKGAARYVVEVKTGSVAPRIQTPATRRQLLEYRVAFDVDGVLLLDAENARMHAVTFPGVGGPREEPRRGASVLLVTALVAAVVCALLAFALTRSLLPE
jgi:hypothetical protein